MVALPRQPPAPKSRCLALGFAGRRVANSDSSNGSKLPKRRSNRGTSGWLLNRQGVPSTVGCSKPGFVLAGVDISKQNRALPNIQGFATASDSGHVNRTKAYEWIHKPVRVLRPELKRQELEMSS